MNVDQILTLIVSSLRKQFPEALYQGRLLTEKKSFDPATNDNVTVVSDERAVEVIFDNFTSDDISSSEILKNDVKLYIIAKDVTSIDYYDIVEVFNTRYTIVRLMQHVIGSKAALFTIAARKG